MKKSLNNLKIAKNEEIIVVSLGWMEVPDEIGG